MTEKIRVSIVGAPGYGGGEALRLLSRHPFAEIRIPVSGTFAGQPVARLFPGSFDRNLRFEQFDQDKLISESDVIFIAQESGFAMKHVPEFLAAGLKIVDFSADFRLKDPAVYAEWYRLEHACPDILEKAVFGLPEYYREQIKKASLVANPGCYPTASILALAPLLERKIVDPESLIIDAKSGASGAGRGKTSHEFHFPELNESVRAYGIAGTHRHTPEIEQVLSSIYGTRLSVSFTPHLIPMTRGIMATCYANPVRKESTSSIRQLYAERYRDEPFVIVYPEGELPSTKGTCGSNQCHIGAAVDSRTGRITVISAIDNLVKGAAGQAIQNMNIMMGLPEKTGLDIAGVWP